MYNLSGDIGWVGDPVFRQSANNQPDMQGVRKMYLSVGVPKEFIEEDYIPLLKMMLNDIDYTLSKTVDPK